MADQLTEEQIAFFKEAWWRFFDNDRDGIITTAEFVTQIKAMRDELGKPSCAESEAMITEIEADANGTIGTIDFEKFLVLMTKRQAPTTPSAASAPQPQNPQEQTTSKVDDV